MYRFKTREWACFLSLTVYKISSAAMIAKSSRTRGNRNTRYVPSSTHSTIKTARIRPNQIHIVQSAACSTRGTHSDEAVKSEAKFNLKHSTIKGKVQHLRGQKQTVLVACADGWSWTKVLEEEGIATFAGLAVAHTHTIDCGVSTCKAGLRFGSEQCLLCAKQRCTAIVHRTERAIQ